MKIYAHLWLILWEVGDHHAGERRLDVLAVKETAEVLCLPRSTVYKVA